MKKLILNVRHYFAAGLLITLPIFFTLYLLFIIVQFIDSVWGRWINLYIRKHLGFAIPGLGFILAIITVLFIGFLAANFFGKRFFKSIERWFLKFPFIRQVYPALKQIVDSFISKESTAFKKVVLVEYPCKGIWSIGFITNESFREANEKTGSELLHVFIATSPSPLTGFLILVPKSDVKSLDISVESGMKLIMSGGIIRP
ncbi:MAG: DUF502 domain-containing protein [Candidatus Omnitrophica bacterium]|nr:DUF502 domain-containing protein [Candidatus Omnitrophota bacterium]